MNSRLHIFINHLRKVKIVFVTPPSSKEILISRLNKRGHKRIKNPEQTPGFVEKNWHVTYLYKVALQENSIDVIYI